MIVLPITFINTPCMSEAPLRDINWEICVRKKWKDSNQGGCTGAEAG